MKIKISEDEIQKTFVQWLNLAKIKYEQLNLGFHVPNGGKRNGREAVKFKKLGVRAGVPDFIFLYPSNDKHGLILEFKTAKGYVSKVQKYWLEELEKNNYETHVVRDSLEAIEIVKKYFKIK
jgi:hypothetical protein